MKALLRILLLFPLLSICSCGGGGGGGPTAPGGNTGEIVTGPETEVARETIPPSGGTVAVDEPGDPLDGLVLTVPADGFGSSQDVTVSHAEITSHSFGPNFNPVSPLIKIGYQGGYSADLITLEIPIDIPDDHFAMSFFYDETTGKLEPIPVESLDTKSVTISTRHLSSANATLNKGFLREDPNVFGNLVISSIQATVLDGQPTLASGFTPGVDDWEFPNYGSYVAPGGHCAGQAITAMWYFYEKKLKGERPLNHRFDTINDPARPDSLWSDNPRGYRFASTIQEDMDFDGWIKFLNFQHTKPKLTWYCFIYAMLLTGEPQFVVIRDSADGAGHAMIIYKITPATGTLYVADPNYPSNRQGSGALSTRIIEYENETLKPYSSAQISGGPGKSFDQIGYFAKTSFIEWSKISERWPEFLDGTIGDDRFPDYSLWLRNDGVELTGVVTTSADTLKIHCRSTEASGWITDTDHLQRFSAYDLQGGLIADSGPVGKGIVEIITTELGIYPLRFYIQGETAGGQQRFVDFRGVVVDKVQSDIDFSRVKSVGIALISVDTHWKDEDGEPFDKTFSPTWIADVALNGNILSGVSESEDTVSVTVGGSISFQASNRTTLGSLGLAYTSISGTVSPPPTRIEPTYFSYEVQGGGACGTVTSLVLDTFNPNSTLDSYSCDAISVFAITFYY